MAWSSWTNITENDYMDIAFIGQVNQNMLHVRDLVSKYLLHSSVYLDIDTSEGYQTQPLPEYLNRIERNLDSMHKGITWRVPREPSRIWLGEYLDIPTFNYSDVNRWFNDLLIMKLALDSIPEGWRICGTFSCGNSNAAQKFRR